MKPQNFAADSSRANSVCPQAHTQRCLRTGVRPLKSVSTSTIHSGSKILTSALLSRALCAEPFRTCFPPPRWRLQEAAPLSRHPCLGRVVGNLPAAVPGVVELSTAPWLLLLTYLMWIQGTLCSPSAQLPGHVQQSVACAFGTTLNTPPSLTHMLEFLL